MKYIKLFENHTQINIEKLKYLTGKEICSYDRIKFTEEEIKFIENLKSQESKHGFEILSQVPNGYEISKIQNDGIFYLRPIEKHRIMYDCFNLCKIDGGFIKHQFTMICDYGDGCYTGKYSKYFKYTTNDISEVFKNWNKTEDMA